jgi:spermidine synthase
MNAHKVGWFTELSSLWPGQAFSLEVEEILVDLKSNYQHIFIFKSKTYGTCLALDGILQCTERDEFSYQEMITHLALFCHPEPKKVLVIGGGDGCVVREVLKHQYVESVTLCEIDRKVVELCKQHLPFSSSSLDHPKCHIHIGDGLKFMEQHQNEFDVIITDSSDPFGLL